MTGSSDNPDQDIELWLSQLSGKSPQTSGTDDVRSRVAGDVVRAQYAAAFGSNELRGELLRRYSRVRREILVQKQPSPGPWRAFPAALAAGVGGLAVGIAATLMFHFPPFGEGMRPAPLERLAAISHIARESPTKQLSPLSISPPTAVYLLQAGSPERAVGVIARTLVEHNVSFRIESRRGVTVISISPSPPAAEVLRSLLPGVRIGAIANGPIDLKIVASP